MSPSPSTPTPRRFLLPRHATQSQTSNSSSAVGPRFHSTPRFGAMQLTPRFGFSAVPRPTQLRRDIEDVEEVEDRVEESSMEGDEDQEDQEEDGYNDQMNTEGNTLGEKKRRDVLGDSIECFSEGSSAPEDDAMAAGDDGAHYHRRKPDHGIGRIEVDPVDEASPSSSSSPSPCASSPEPREAKRRKLSISPLPAYYPLIKDSTKGAEIEEAEDHDRQENDYLQSDGNSPEHDFDCSDTGAKILQQPTFQPIPRFKPLNDEPFLEGLPAAFSPQRRGAKYISGGLAAELQGWLSEVKGWDGGDAHTESTFRVVVEDVLPGKRMFLVRGTVNGIEEPKRLILAGEGKLTGLGKRADVGRESVVVIGQPVWDVELDGHTWIVACVWTIQES